MGPRPEVVALPNIGMERAVLDLPTGTLLVARGHHRAHGQIEDLERWAATLIAACWEARKLSPNPPGTRADISPGED